MNRALHKLTDEERAEQIAQDKILLFREGNWPDMHQFEEPENDSEWNVIASVVVIWAAIIALVVAWVIVGRLL